MTHATRHYPRLLWLLLGLLALLVLLPAPLHATDPGPDGEPDRLVAPPLPEEPTQLDFGAYEYAQRCMACHGDRGQGLTDEWRAAWGEEEMNCWQSKCHASNHPPEGFELLPYAPQVIGEGALARFETAQELFDFVRANMPWHQPGSLEDELYWQLTAFLLHSNDVALPGEPLGPQNAAKVHLRPAHDSVTPSPESPSPDDAAPAADVAYADVTVLPPWLVGAWMLGMLVTATGAFLALVRRHAR